ncbi:MAG: GNAT family N-acetyltransferase [Oscillospiraceae bacterium]|nr:GNAT family N-acetyltransferase [Oscillospiraceae bacterium]
MRLERVRKGAPVLADVRAVYEAAFPKEERAPFSMLTRKLSLPAVELWAMYDGDTFVGFAYVATREKLAYLYYFAVKAAERGKGYGRAAITELMDLYKEGRFFLALERRDETADNHDERVQRHAFYESCGLKDLPCLIREAYILFDAMGVGGDVSPEEYRALIDGFLGPVRRRILGMKLTAVKN